MRGYRSGGGGFAEGFQGGWGLADTYLNRQQDRKRQAFEDDRRAEQTRYDRGRDEQSDALAKTALTRRNLLEEYNAVQAGVTRDTAEAERWVAEDRAVKKEERAAEIHKATVERNDQVIAAGKIKGEADQRNEHNRKRALAYHKLTSLPDPEDMSDPRVVEALRDISVLSELDIKNPGQAWAHYEKINSAIQKGEFTERDAVAANAVYGEALNQRPTAIDEAKKVRTTDGKEVTIPAGSEITQRDVVGLTPVKGGKGFVMQLRIMAKGSDGKDYEYFADATVGGSASGQSNPQVHQPQEFLGINQLKMSLIQQMKGATALIDKREGANYANSEVGKGQLALNKNEAEIAAKKAVAATSNYNLVTAKEKEYRTWRDGLMKVTAKDKTNQVGKRAAWSAATGSIMSTLNRAIPGLKGKMSNLSTGQLDILYNEFNALYEANKNKGRGMFDFRHRGADNQLLEKFARALIKTTIPPAQQAAVLEKVKAEVKVQEKAKDEGLSSVVEGRQKFNNTVDASGRSRNEFEAVRAKLMKNSTEG
tara:strand:+ start:207 stop:1814 length:1608 start_codon:yes stop_codon:yes gene_type:complete